MKDHRFAIGRQLHIAFNGIIALDSRGKGTFRILNDALALGMQPAVRNRPRDKPVEFTQLRRKTHAYSISAMASISTERLKGSAGAPTADRA